MRRALALLPLFLGCTPDYDLTKEEPANKPAEPEDSGIPGGSAEPEPEPDPEDTGIPGGSDATEPDPDAPVAVCAVSPNPVEPPFTTATWDGSGSYDPAGLRITSYNWTLSSQPSGSSVRMPSGSGAIRSGFSPDLAGEYVGQLVVTTEDGRVSRPCTVTLESIPSEDLWIEMYWQFSGDDMDLHLLNAGFGSSALTTDNDCYYGNCVGSWGALNWGYPSATTDDPSLDLDDIPGVGPENINIAAPFNGNYTVYVHDYPGSVYNGTNLVTVNIYVAGRLAWSDTRDVNSEGYYAPFAVINWPAGTVTSL